jgi:hypothetical protein
MSTGFDRARVPAWPEYAGAQLGLGLTGRGRWRTTRCDLHGGSDSLRVNVETGAWRCMSCEAKGGDTLSHYMALMSLDFVSAARALGCYVEGGNSPPRTRSFSAGDALSVVGIELGICVQVLSAARRGKLPNDDDWQRFLAAAGRVQAVAAEVLR